MVEYEKDGKKKLENLNIIIEIDENGEMSDFDISLRDSELPYRNTEEFEYVVEEFEKVKEVNNKKFRCLLARELNCFACSALYRFQLIFIRRKRKAPPQQQVQYIVVPSGRGGGKEQHFVQQVDAKKAGSARSIVATPPQQQHQQQRYAVVRSGGVGAAAAVAAASDPSKLRQMLEKKQQVIASASPIHHHQQAAVKQKVVGPAMRTSTPQRTTPIVHNKPQPKPQIQPQIQELSSDEETGRKQRPKSMYETTTPNSRSTPTPHQQQPRSTPPTGSVRGVKYVTVVQEQSGDKKPRKLHKCVKCDAVFNGFSEFCTHAHTAHAGETTGSEDDPDGPPFRCSHCSMEFNSARQAQRHKSSHQEDSKDKGSATVDQTKRRSQSKNTPTSQTKPEGGGGSDTDEASEGKAAEMDVEEIIYLEAPDDN